jgi:MATE family multidrug resistance protein
MPSHLRNLSRLAIPLVLSSSTVTIMQVIDAVILARHSDEAVAAMGAGGMAVILVQAIVFGTTGYTSVFCSHAQGAGDARGIFRGTWQGIHLSWILGLVLAVLAWPSSQLFHRLGHAPAVAADEALYFRILVVATVLPALVSGMAGWLSGQGRTRLLTAVQVGGFAVNAVLAWALVLGNWGFPRLGMAGAALATLAGQGFDCLILALLFWRDGGLRVAADRRIDVPELRRFLVLALPQGLRISLELLAWTAFLFFVGRIGTVELAASSIAFRINGMAFFPLVGLGQAAGILTGQARGAGRDLDVPSIGWQALLLGEGWMLLFVILFLLIPQQLFGIFTGARSPEVLVLGCGLLKYVAVYSLFDAANVILASILSAAGDTRWTLRLFLVASSAFLAGMAATDRMQGELWIYWSMATGFVSFTAAAWMVRFRSGSWKSCRVLAES